MCNPRQVTAALFVILICATTLGQSSSLSPNGTITTSWASRSGNNGNAKVWWGGEYTVASGYQAYGTGAELNPRYDEYDPNTANYWMGASATAPSGDWTWWAYKNHLAPTPCWFRGVLWYRSTLTGKMYQTKWSNVYQG